MRTAALLALALYASGCAVHVPMSEVAVFREHSSRFGALPAHLSAPVLTAGRTVPDSLRQLNRSGLSIALHTTRLGSRGAVSGTGGLAASGVDGVVRVAGPVHVLASGSAFGGAEGFVLARLPVPSQSLGVSVGGGSRCRYDLLNLGELFLLPRPALRGYEAAWRCSVGARSTVAWLPSETGSGVLGTAYVGVAPGGEGVVFAIGLAGITY